MSNVKKVRNEIMDVIKRHSRPGMTFRVGGDPYTVVSAVCDGSIPDMAYYCIMEPGHDGQCYSASKRVHFDREGV